MSGNVNMLAFACDKYYLRAKPRPRRGPIRQRRDKAIEMDDSRDTSVVHVWAAEANEAVQSGDKAAFTIGELSREFGVTLRALRFYENKGLISPHREGLSRLYSQGDRTRLALILKGKKLGFTLGEIRQMIAAEEGSADAKTLGLNREKCLEQIELLKKQKAEIEDGLRELSRIYASLGGNTDDRRAN
jgi:DNA-binding transcriptional MerR regulator